MSKDKYLVLATFALSNTNEEYRLLVTSLVILATSTFLYSLEFIFLLLWEVWKMRSFASLYILWILEPLCIVSINLWDCAVQLQIRTILKRNHGDSMTHVHKAWFRTFFPTSLSSVFFVPRSLLVTSRNFGHTTIFKGSTILILAMHLSTSLNSLFKCQLFRAFHHRINYYTILA